MGNEARCTVHIDGQRFEGKALLETDELIFRGGCRLVIARAAITRLEADNGKLHISHPGGIAVFELGQAAAKWAEKIRNPRSLLDKLGVKPGMRVAVLGVDDPAFLAQLADRTDDVTRRAPREDTDVIIFAARSAADLDRLGKLRNALKPDGAVWVVHAKGKDAPFRDVDVFAAAKRAGLVDNKVASFSATHTAERLVIPLSQR